MPLFRYALLTTLLCPLLSSSCTLIKVADSAASATIGVASTAVKVTGKVVQTAIPAGGKEAAQEDSD